MHTFNLYLFGKRAVSSRNLWFSTKHTYKSLIKPPQKQLNVTEANGYNIHEFKVLQCVVKKVVQGDSTNKKEIHEEEGRYEERARASFSIYKRVKLGR